MQYNEKLDAALAALKGDMVETLQRWVRVPSVRAERSAENAPFGADVRRALDTAMADLKRLGFEPRDVDGYCCDTEIGSGDDVVAVLAHLDVVPEGDGWNHDPYGAEIIDGRMIGRGTSDDKGPGVAAHASFPEKGKNAAKMLVHVLAKLGIGGAPIALLDEAAGRESAGEDLGIAGSDKVSGALTINLGLLFAREGKIDVTFDCRYPVFFNPETIGETVQRRLAPAGYALEPIKPSVPHHVPESSELVAKLMDVYNTITGESAKPFAIGGGTYARHLKEGVAYGMLFPGELELEHQANESIDVANFVKAARIYAYAIVALCA